MTDPVEETCKVLEEKGIRYTRFDHEAVFTMEEMERIGLPELPLVCKNLFLRDQKGRRHFLVSIRGDKSADLRALGELLGTKLSFASEERLARLLGLGKGSVTPLGILNDREAAVEVLFDEDLQRQGRVGVHPCLNTATVFLEFSDLARLVRDNGNRVKILKL